MLPDYYKSELYHYGVLGMKWGIRKGRTEQAYTKASKKLNKLDRKVNKAEAKALKTRAKADAKMGSLFYSEKKAKKAEFKAERKAAKVTRKLRRAQRWYKSMEKNFANTDIKLSQEQIAIGQRYVDRLDLRTFTY